MGEVLVSARGVAKAFGATPALGGVDIRIRRGEVHALLGGNGAGKSTLIGVLAGDVVPDAGELHVSAERVAVVHQEPAILPELSVAENIAVGLRPGLRFRWADAAREANRVLDLLGMADRSIGPATLARHLKLHQLQLVEIGRALSTGADVILLDEPTASLATEETDRLFEVVRELTRQGIAFVLVSHRMQEIRRIADVVTVLRDGRTVVNAVPLAAVTDDAIVHAMFGAQLAQERARRHVPPRHDGDVRGLRLRHHASGTQVRLAPGEVLGLAGPPQGPAALIGAVLGVDSGGGWEIDLDGRPWRARSPRQAVRGGVGFISGDRAAKGTFPELSIRDNAVLARQVVERRLLRRPRELTEVQGQATALGFGRADVGALPARLSGGTLQKVLIARWLGLPLRVLLLEEPTRGVDVRTKTDLYRLVHGMSDAGVVVVWWSTEHSELLSVADRILAFSVTGQPVGTVPAGAADERQLLRLTGTT